ncbi:MAG: hypothetical protein ACTH31_09040, partial [Pseudoclavibacter sp.]
GGLGDELRRRWERLDVFEKVIDLVRHADPFRIVAIPEGTVPHCCDSLAMGGLRKGCARRRVAVVAGRDMGQMRGAGEP